MADKDSLSVLERRVLVFTLLFCLVPYGSVRLYLASAMHGSTDFAAAPGPWFLTSMLVLAGAVPGLALALIARRLVAERDRFRLGMLLEIYFSLILVFGVSYGVAQAGSAESAFSGMSVVWELDDPVSLSTHVGRFHAALLESLYLSIITMTTVGYGDLVPVSSVAKGLTALQGLLGIGFVGLALGHYFSVCLHCRPDADSQVVRAR